MLHRAYCNRMLYTSIFPFFSSINSYDATPNQEISELAPGEIGLDRLKKILRTTPDGVRSREYQSVANTTIAGSLGGFMLGGLIKSRLAVETFMEENQAIKFESKQVAQRQLQLRFFNAFLKGGIRLGFKVGMFCFIFTSASTCFYAYRGKYDVNNFTFAGAVTGFIFQLNRGIKGAFAGTLVGTVLGCIYGCVGQIMFYISGVKMEDIYDTHAKYASNYQVKINKKIRKVLDESTEKTLFEENEQLKRAMDSQSKDAKD